MARLFDDGSSEYLEYGGAVLTVAPITLAAWFYSDDVTVGQTLIALLDADNDSDYLRLTAQGNAAGDPIRLHAEGTDGGTADTTTGFSANTWHSAVGRENGNSRDVWIDGGSKGTNANAVTLTGIDLTRIGYRNASAAQHMSGRVAWAAVWNVSLSDDDVAAYADGYSPSLIRPDALVAFWPLGGFHDDNSGNAANSDWDVVGGYHMDPQNTPSVADHPGGLIYPSRPQSVYPAAVAAGFVSQKHHILGGGIAA
jgi:hypothetical protein